MKNLNSKFIEEIARIKAPEVFLGVARILRVQLIKEEKDENGQYLARPFEEICADVITAFSESDRHRKRELLRILQKANQYKEDKVDANRTENSEAGLSN